MIDDHSTSIYHKEDSSDIGTSSIRNIGGDILGSIQRSMHKHNTVAIRVWVPRRGYLIYS